MKDTFDLKKYLKEGKLYEDLPKGKWVTLDKKVVLEQAEYSKR